MLSHLSRRLVLQEWSGRAAGLRASSGEVRGWRTVGGWQQWLQWPEITRYIVQFALVCDGFYL